MKKIKKSKESGFSLIELLLYMGLFSIFLITLTQIFSSALELKLESESTSTVQQDSRYILERLSYDINRADSITTPAAIGTQGQLLSLVISGQTYSYTLNGNNFTLTNPSGTFQLNGFNTRVTNLSFLRVGNSGGKNSIQISYTINSLTIQNKGTETKTIQTTLGIR